VKTALFIVLGVLLTFSPVRAHEGGGRGFGPGAGFGGLGWDGLGDFRGLGFGFGDGDHHGGFGGFCLFGGFFGLGSVNTDLIQTRFENQFDALKTQYNDGVAGITDFFTSTEYDTIVNKTERLDDRYGLFVSGVERSIDRLGDLISITNDDISFFSDLLANYQADTDISPARLDRIELVIGRITDRLSTRVDSLTDKQTTLQTNLPTYQSFQTDISTFLSDIVAAGGGTTTTSLTAISGESLDAVLATKVDLSASVGVTTLSSPSSVPEPASFVLLASAALAGALFSRRRPRRVN